ncbi:hypothetical protein Pelo_4859 [Pelomyxa schiedti]|nr:hypothetical protein Pelo_4859 [Pelomyxa schiedti]
MGDDNDDVSRVSCGVCGRLYDCCESPLALPTPTTSPNAATPTTAATTTTTPKADAPTTTASSDLLLLSSSSSGVPVVMPCRCGHTVCAGCADAGRSLAILCGGSAGGRRGTSGTHQQEEPGFLETVGHHHHAGAGMTSPAPPYTNVVCAAVGTSKNFGVSAAVTDDPIKCLLCGAVGVVPSSLRTIEALTVNESLFPAINSFKSAPKRVLCSMECENEASVTCADCGCSMCSMHERVIHVGFLKSHTRSLLPVVKPSTPTTSHLFPPIPPPTQIMKCKEHNEPLKLFCKSSSSSSASKSPSEQNHQQQEEAETCQRAVCIVCAQFGLHKGHNVVPINDWSDECHKTLSGCVQDLKERSKSLSLLHDELRIETSDYSKIVHKFENDVNALFTSLFEALDTKRTELLDASAKLKAACDFQAAERLSHLERISSQIKVASHRFELPLEEEGTTMNLPFLAETIQQCRNLLKILTTGSISKWDPLRFDVKVANAQPILSLIANIGSISLVGPPAEVTGVDIVSVTSTTVTVKWNPAIERGAPVTRYEVNIADVMNKVCSTKTVVAPTTTCQVIIDGLRPGTEYSAVVRAATQVGSSPFSQPTKSVKTKSTPGVVVKLWGAGGGSCGNSGAGGDGKIATCGGGGGFVQGIVRLEPGSGGIRVTVGGFGGCWNEGFFGEDPTGVKQAVPQQPQVKGGHMGGGGSSGYNPDNLQGVGGTKGGGGSGGSSNAGGGGGGASFIEDNVTGALIAAAGGGGGGGGRCSGGGGGGGGANGSNLGSGGAGGRNLNGGHEGVNGNGGGGGAGPPPTSGGRSDTGGGNGGFVGCNATSGQCGGGGGGQSHTGNPDYVGGGGGGGGGSTVGLESGSVVTRDAVSCQVNAANEGDAHWASPAGRGGCDYKHGNTGRVVILTEDGATVLAVFDKCGSFSWSLP